MIALTERSETRKSKNTIVNDLTKSPPVYKINQENFGLGHLVRENSSDPFHDESYFNIRYYQVTVTLQDSGIIDYNRTEYNHDFCGDNYPFTDVEFAVSSGLKYSVRCPETQSYEISGAGTSKVNKYIEIKISKCSNSTSSVTCKTSDEINTALSNSDFSLAIENRYFDFDDYDTPVKSYLVGSENYKILKSLQKHITLYLRRNEYALNDDLIQYRDQQTGSFYSIDRQKMDLEEIKDDTVVTIQIVQDPMVDQYERNIFTFLEMTGQLGGLYEVLTVLASFLISGIAQKLFTLSILKNLYYVDCDFQDTDDNLEENSQISSFQNRPSLNREEIRDKNKLQSIDQNNSNSNANEDEAEAEEAKNTNNKHRWFRRETNHENKEDNENNGFNQPESEFNENMISQKLSMMAIYAPKSKDYFYLISKMIRWFTFCK